MKRIKYTPDAAERLRTIKREVARNYGKDKAQEITGLLIKSIKSLLDNENKGPSIENILGIETDYRYLYVAQNYIFYRIEDTCICIINIYHEKEDFMWHLFGIDTISSETIDYWKE